MVRKEATIRGGSGYRADRCHSVWLCARGSSAAGSSATSAGSARGSASSAGGGARASGARDAGYYGARASGANIRARACSEYWQHDGS